MRERHTSGPWLAEAADVFGDHNIVLLSSANDCRAVAAVVSNMRDPSEVSANAFLVAAAPDLLAVACEMLPRNLCLTNPNIPDSTVVPLDVTMGELRRIAAAIVKARGAA
ncbi:hypothetical protein [Sphingopyxis macrogoltabida]|uniref:Uncharacterized protein n=1 Tax=Sphingopyxis macrogoltabida TaxID=33050 RepID=A0AAC9FFP6_SPHMC|nr:hypothetical protein [Sphingopyxis macrogoltabida]ALJ12599.1 hypothetical protein LH19_06945 [Sphingopyxis macrogoltabida]AMU89930.1 hypothetical protein ATM17_12875 [Sphingopyxis macrogoltabida]